MEKKEKKRKGKGKERKGKERKGKERKGKNKTAISVLQEKNKILGLVLPYFKIYYSSQDCVIRKILDRPMEIYFNMLHKHNQPIIDKRSKAIQWSKDCPFNKWS